MLVDSHSVRRQALGEISVLGMNVFYWLLVLLNGVTGSVG